MENAQPEVETATSEIEEQLYKTCWTMLEMLPERLNKILFLFVVSHTRNEQAHWESEAIKAAIELAEPVVDEETSEVVQPLQSLCPLCKGFPVNEDWREDGYKLPDDLRNHILGVAGHSRCGVMAAMTIIGNQFARESQEI